MLGFLGMFSVLGHKETLTNAEVMDVQAALAVEKRFNDDNHMNEAYVQNEAHLNIAELPTLYYRDTGETVVKLQEMLGVEADGIFGKMTQEKVEEVQAENDLVADGVVDRETWEVLAVKGKRLSYAE